MEVNYETLFEILRNEKNREELQTLDTDFYDKLTSFLKEKQSEYEHKKSKIDPFNIEECKMVENELFNVKRIIKEIYDRREKKINTMALNRVKIRGAVIDTDSLLKSEKQIFESLVSVLSGYRADIIEKILANQVPSTISSHETDEEKNNEADEEKKLKELKKDEDTTSKKTESEATDEGIDETKTNDEKEPTGSTETELETYGQENSKDSSEPQEQENEEDKTHEDIPKIRGSEEEAENTSTAQKATETNTDELEDSLFDDAKLFSEDEGETKQNTPKKTDDEMSNQDKKTHSTSAEEPKSLKKDDESSQNTFKIEVKEDVSQFIGSDLEIYGPFEKGDVIEVPKGICDVLINQGRAKEI